MAQSWRGARDAIPPLDRDRLERMALRYVERYATSRAKLADYLHRKLRERGWAEEEPPPVSAIAERFATLGYVDDQAFASARAASLVRRGFGPRRVAQALHAAGIDEQDAAPARDQTAAAAWEAALGFARRKRIGPFASQAPDRAAREKAFAALLRAGHDMTTARLLVNASPGVVPERDER